MLHRVNSAQSKLSSDKVSITPVAAPTLHIVRKDRFHKLFPDIADSDVVIKSYHCAYVSDILLQGFLYVTHNWFCFYSKLLGKKRIKILVSSITNITKKKTAIIIPNAVGIVTEDHKQYVFGSLMSRDNTFRLLFSIWQQKLEDLEKAPVDLDVGSDVVEMESLANKSLTNASTASSDDCVASSSSDASFCSDVAGSREKLHVTAAATSTVSPTSNSMNSRPANSVTSPPSLRKVSSSSPTCSPSRSSRSQYSVRLKRSLSALAELLRWLNSLPRTSLFLLISTVLVLILLCSAALLTYKLLQLQARLDAGLRGWSIAGEGGSRPSLSQLHGSRLAHDIYTIRHEREMSTVQEIHAMLQAHVQLLDQVNEALKGLYSWVIKDQKSDADNT